MNLNIHKLKFHHGSMNFCYQAEISNRITGIFGNSGSGKTTLLNLLCGIETPDSGRIEFNGRTLIDTNRKMCIPAHKRNFGVVFQGNYLFPHLNVRKNLQYSKAFGREKNLMIREDEVIELLEIGRLMHKKPFRLSGGECQRVAIGRSLLSQPGMLLMDEPFSNLDRDRRMEIISYLRRITTAFDIPLIIISHDLEDILRLTQYLLIIRDGRITASGSYHDLRDNASPDRAGLPLRHLEPYPDPALQTRVG